MTTQREACWGIGVARGREAGSRSKIDWKRGCSNTKMMQNKSSITKMMRN